MLELLAMLMDPFVCHPFVPNEHGAASMQRVCVSLTVSTEIPPENGSFLHDRNAEVGVDEGCGPTCLDRAEIYHKGCHSIPSFQLEHGTRRRCSMVKVRFVMAANPIVNDLEVLAIRMLHIQTCEHGDLVVQLPNSGVC